MATDNDNSVEVSADLQAQIVAALLAGDAKTVSKLTKKARMTGYDPSRDVRKLAMTLGTPAHSLQANMVYTGGKVSIADGESVIVPPLSPQRFAAFVARVSGCAQLARKNQAADSE